VATLSRTKERQGQHSQITPVLACCSLLGWLLGALHDTLAAARLAAVAACAAAPLCVLRRVFSPPLPACCGLAS
jgi:hypothetical protein